MRITFVLPKFSRNPIGGVRIAYEYANRLQARGHEVTVVHPVPGLEFGGLRRWLHHRPWRIRAHALRAGGRPGWFPLHPDVRTTAVPGRTPRELPSGDVVVATAWQTAEYLASAPPSAGAHAYLIQHLETWSGPRGRVEATWRLPMHKIVIARWLQEQAGRLDGRGPVSYVPNGMDFDAFPLERPIDDRDPLHVGLMLHPVAWKGTGVGLAALAAAREQEPRLRVSAFGTYGADAGLPDWVDFRGRLAGPDLAAFYNELATFVHPSDQEGWPLTPAEAMSCGAALAATDNPGVLDYARPDETALVSARGDVDALAASVLRLAREGDLRRRLASSAATAIRTYTWERAVDGFEGALVAAT
ncbi:glycosyltransferase family 4 protein [Patulibacter sp. NPDC049589]|uniref:glycosyltransferase family 4 protein n=1 Tax=Patulibacter sp. NPDC049589 TaxID=3154731 RepID=UPI0034139BA5